MKQYKKDLIKNLFERTKSLENDKENLEKFCIEMNIKNDERVTKLIKTNEECMSGYWDLLNNLLIDEESNEYFKEVYLMQNREMKEFVEKSKDHVNQMIDIQAFPELTLLNEMTTLEVNKHYILADRLYNHDNYRKCMMKVAFVKLEIKNNKTLVWFKAPNYQEFSLELDKIKNSLYTFEAVKILKGNEPK